MIPDHTKAERRELKEAIKRYTGSSRVLGEVYGMRLVADELAIVTGQGRFPLTPEAIATISVDGNVAVTRGRDLGAKAAGTLFMGPIGTALFGNAKTTTHDHRIVEIVVTGSGWRQSKLLGGPWAPDAAKFVQRINDEVQRLTPPPQRPTTPVLSMPLAQLPPPVASTGTLRSAEINRLISILRRRRDQLDRPPADVFDAIARLGQLREAGHLTDTEFADKKAELLARL